MIPLPFDPLDLPMIDLPKGLWRPLMLNVREASFARRGFTEASPERRRHLEYIGELFIAGYNSALQATDIQSVISAIVGAPLSHRGFVAEGSAMGVCVHDALSFRRPLLPELIAEFERDFTYLAHVGCGWAMARLPWRRSKIMASMDTLLVPLAFDGWGFHDCYFDPDRLVAGPGRVIGRIGGGGAERAWDQGAGRALWFISGGDVASACSTIRRLAPSRHGDLFSGLGLAVTYAGGVDPDAAARLRGEAGRLAGNLAQGSAFALEAHVRAGTDTAATAAISTALTRMSSRDTTAIVRRAMPVPLGTRATHVNAGWNLYEAWRSTVIAEMQSSGRNAA